MTFSAPLSQKSSFMMSLPASATAWSSPSGPLTLGPRRVCMRARPRRSTHSAIMTLTMRKATMKTALMRVSHQVSAEKSATTPPLETASSAAA